MRLDAALVEAGLARSRAQAKELIAAGSVRVRGRLAGKASAEVDGIGDLAVDQPDHYVSRAAHKLLGALADSQAVVRGRALDAGASTGGFTQVLLEQGCTQVFAVDVGHGQLHPSLRGDPRVVVREGLNVRDLTLADVGGSPVDVVVADLSFISLRIVLPALLRVAADAATVLLLVKPQFELGAAALDSRGVVRDDAARWTAVESVIAAAADLGWHTKWSGRSQRTGPAGNVEYVVHMTKA